MITGDAPHPDNFPRCYLVFMGFPGGSSGKESTCNAGDLGLIPGLGTSPGEGKGYPLQYSCLEDPMDRGTWRAMVHGVVKGQNAITRRKDTVIKLRKCTLV